MPVLLSPLCTYRKSKNFYLLLATCYLYTCKKKNTKNSPRFFVLSCFEVLLSDGNSKTQRNTCYKKLVSRFLQKNYPKNRNRCFLFSQLFVSYFWVFLGVGRPKTPHTSHKHKSRGNIRPTYFDSDDPGGPLCVCWHAGHAHWALMGVFLRLGSSCQSRFLADDGRPLLLLLGYWVLPPFQDK
jgi:hypothetical protein